MQKDEPAYPAYALPERVADGIVHAFGVVLAITGAMLLIVFAARHGGLGSGQVAAVSVYGGALIATFLASACYHMTPWEGPRPWLRRLVSAERAYRKG